MQKAILSLLFVAFLSPVFAQNKQIDSLKVVIEGMPEDTNKVNTLILLANKLVMSDPELTIQYSTEAIQLAEQLNYKRGLGYALKSMGMGHYFQAEFLEVLLYWQQSLNTFDSIGEKIGVANMSNNLGSVHFNQGNDTKAIEYYLKSLKISEETGDKLRIATALLNIGNVYSNKPATHDLALNYYYRALPMCRELNNQEALGTVAVNMGEIFLKKDVIDSALYYFNISLEAYTSSGSVKEAYTLNNIGKAYTARGEYKEAIEFQKKALIKAESLDAKLEMAQALNGLGNTYMSMGNFQEAITAFKKSEALTTEIESNYDLKFSYEGLAKSYEMLKDFGSAYKYQKLYNNIKDTIYNSEMDKKLQLLTMNLEMEKKQSDIDLLTKDNALKNLNLQRQRIAIYAAGSTGFMLLLFAIGIFNRYKYVRKTKKIIEDEKERSEKLLLNILPHETANELKEKGFATPKHYDKVSVLFTDFKGFTKIAEKLTAQELIAELNYCFFEFDKIIDKHHLEKIKTIGDAYMCAGGIPVANDTNPVDIVRAALEIKAFMDNLRITRESEGKDYWELRIGIHTGEVVAGVVGKNKFAYDIWGDAVNTASRMESSGIPGQVNISGATYEFIKDQFVCTHRGKVYAKNKGEIDMYIVEGEK